MKTNIKTRTIAAVTLLLWLVAPLSAEAKMGKALNDTASVGMNALDYVLQRPLGNSSFEHKRFGDKFFITAGGGISTYNQKPSNGFRPGFRGELSFGDWITPVHGWRIGFNAGIHSKKSGQSWKGFGSVSADYLMNFSALLRGYNPSRRVELIGALGAEYQRIRYRGAWGNEIGLRAAIQARINIQQNLYLYLEPRMTLLAGTRFAGDSYRRFRTDLSFNVGLGYRLLSKAERLAGATEFVNSVDNHLFFGVGGGVWAFARKAASQRKSPYGFGSFFVGKYFSPTAGIRVKAEFGRIDQIGTTAHRYLATGSLDFVWNLNSAFGGYRPDQVFDLSLNIGPAVAYSDKAKAKFYPGVAAGITALFRLSDNWGIFIEPEVKLFSKSFNQDLNGGGYGPFVSMNAGLRYTIGNFKHDNPRSYEDFFKAKNSFLTFAVGAAKRYKGNYGKGVAAQVGFGSRFTPISSWRISGEGELYSATPHYLSLTVNADYLLSISSSMAGFNPYRVFDLSALVGLTAGIGHHRGPLKPLVGGRVGLHGAFRLSDALDLYFEPLVTGSRMIGKSSPGWSPELMVMVGLKYKLGTPSGIIANFADTPLADGRNFVSISGGPAFFSSTFVSAPRKVSGSVDASVGRWFSRVSGGRIGYTFDIVTQRGKTKRPFINTIHADYLLNITSLMDQNPDRRFHIIGTVGAGLSFSNLHNAKVGPILEGGFQFRYNLPSNIDIHIEPNASFLPNRIIPGYQSGSRVVVMSRIMTGLSYRF